MAHILLVDDEVDFRQLLMSMLAAEGHVVFGTGNGNEALELCRQKPVELIITDLIMPDKEGLEMIIEMRRDYPHLKFIAMTGGGYGSAADYLSFARALGAAKTLTKPFSRKDLLDAVSFATTSA